jgi:parvulin-like peptidyl-prolyl isomerase
LVLFLAHCGTKEEIVATVGKLDITRSQFVKEMAKMQGEKPNYQDVELERKKNVLNNMIKRKLRLMEAYATGLDDEEEVENMIASYRKRIIANKYYEQIIVGRLVSQQALNDYLYRQGVEMKATHILIGFTGTNVAVNRSREEAKILAEQIIQESKSGKDFTELVLKYSDDPGAKNTKGSTQYFKWGESLGPYQDAAWNLKTGEISSPVETKYGYYIIRLDDRREIPGFKADTSKENILRARRALFQAKGDSGTIVANQQLLELKKKYRAEIDSVAIKNLASLLTEKIKSETVTKDSFNPQQKKIVLSRWKGGSITWKYILDLYSDRLTRVIGPFRQANLLQQEIENSTNLEIVVKDAEEYGLADEEEMEKQISAFLEDRLIQLIERREVDDKATVTDDEVLKYYEANPNKFMKSEEMETWQIYVKNEKLAKTIAAKARAGSDFTALVKKYSEDKTSVNKGGYLGFRSVSALGSAGPEAFKLGPNKIGGPVQSRGGWIVFKTGKKTEKVTRPFTEVENQARNMLRTERIKETRVLWEQNLEKKFKPIIKEEILKQV